MNKLIIVIFSCFSISAFGSDSRYIAIGISEQKPVAVGLVRKADYVAVTLSIRSDQRDGEVRNEELSRVRQMVLQETKKNEKINARIGVPALNFREAGSLKFSSYGNEESRAAIILYHSFGTNSIYQASRELKQFVKGLKLPDKVSADLSDVRLAIASPESYRGEILAKLKEEIQQTAARLELGKVTISGLESPVFVRQMDEENVELFLNYKLSVEKE